jgi:hypothetical protein
MRRLVKDIVVQSIAVAVGVGLVVVLYTASLWMGKHEK